MDWSVVAVVVAACSSVLATLWLALMLLGRAFESVTQMCVGVVRSLLGQPDPDDDQVQFEDQIGSTSGLFETLPAWQYWGRDAEGEAAPPVSPVPVESDDSDGDAA
jgi:hypothetical protein